MLDVALTTVQIILNIAIIVLLVKIMKQDKNNEE